MRHGLGPESADWGKEVTQSLRSLESGLVLLRQSLNVLNDQARQQQILAGNVTNRLQESSPAGLRWTVSSSLPSGGGFVGPDFEVTAPEWATGVLVNTLWAVSLPVPGSAEAGTYHSLSPLTSLTGAARSGRWFVDDEGVGLDAQYGFTGAFLPLPPLEGGGRTLYSRFHVEPGASGAVNAVFHIGVVWTA